MRIVNAVLPLFLLVSLSSQALADDLIQVQGMVTVPESRGSAAGVTVTAFDDKDQVVGQTITDPSGKYHMIVPKAALHLEAKKEGGRKGGALGNIIGQVARSSGSILTTPNLSGLASSGLGGVSPLGGFGLAALNGANPLKVLTNLTIISMVNRLVSAGMPTAKAEKTAADLKAGKLTKDQALQQMQEAGVPKDKAETALLAMAKDGTSAAAAPTRTAPGAIQLKATLEGLGELTGVAQAYLITPDTQPGSKGGSLIATMDTLSLQPKGGDAPSSIVHETMLFVAAQIDPVIVHYGETAHLKVLLGLPSDNKRIVVLARTKGGEVVPLEAGDGGVYQADIAIDKKLSRGEQTISVIAYLSAADGRDKKIEQEIEKAGLWNGEKAYLFNPMTRTSKNRADLKITVLEANTH